jgi:hypothetical protein
MPDTAKEAAQVNPWRNIWTITKRELGLISRRPRLRLHRDLPAAMRVLHVLRGRIFRAGRRPAWCGPFFDWHPWFYLFLVPAVGMRLWAEERRVGTIELAADDAHHRLAGHRREVPGLLALPGLALVLTFPVVITVNYLGHPTTASSSPPTSGAG